MVVQKFFTIKRVEQKNNVLEQADNEYLKLGSKLGDLLEVYFMKIFTEIFELVED